MSSSEQTTQDSQVAGEKAAWFGATHWSLVLQAGQATSPQAEAALAKLCETYWYPLYLFVRRQGQSPEDAQDLVQGFFARVLEKNYFRDAERDKGKFRSFLLLALKRFMANEWVRGNRLKRGGGQAVLSLDEQSTEGRYAVEPADEMSPEKAFERRWAMTLLDQVLRKLEAEFSASGKGKLFAELKGFLGGQTSGDTYARLGQRLGMSEANMKVTVHRMRQRYRELLRLEIAATVDGPEAIDDEIRHLFAALG